MSNNQNANHPDSGNYITGATLIEALLAEHHYFKGTDYQGLPETLKAAADRIAELERQAAEAKEAGRQRGLHEAADMVVKLGYAWTGLHGAIVGLGQEDGP